MKRRYFLESSLILIAGCTAATSNANSRSFNSDIRSQPEKLRFTVTGLEDLEQLQRNYDPLRTALEEVLEQKIEFAPFESYIAAAAALQVDQVDLVLTGPSEYVVMRARTNAVPVIGITRPHYRSVICVSANSKITLLAQLKGKKIAMWEVGSTSGHLGPTQLLIDAGLNPHSDLEILMLGSEGLPALKKGEIDAWGGTARRYQNFLQNQKLSKNSLPLIAQGPLLPNDLFVVNSKFAPECVKKISERMVKNREKLLQSLFPAESGKYKGSDLVPVNDSDYNMIRAVYTAIGQGRFIQ